MKKLFLLLAALPTLAIAQPVVNSVSIPLGDTATAYLFADYPITSLATTGSQSWDFSAIPESKYTETANVAYLASSATPYSADFPTSNVCLYMGADLGDGTLLHIFNYAQINADSLWMLGTKSPHVLYEDEILSNPEVLFKFPYALNDIKTDVYQYVGADADSSRTKYVAWGSLKTAYGTYDNVVLLEEYYFDDEIEAWELDFYRWVDVATLREVFHLYWDIDDGVAVLNYGEIYNWFSSTTHIAQEEIVKQYQLQVYPNPSSDKSLVSFRLNTATDVQIQLMSVDGKINQQVVSTTLQAGEHQIPLQVSNLAAGTYFVRILFGNTAYATTLVVEK